MHIIHRRFIYKGHTSTRQGNLRYRKPCSLSRRCTKKGQTERPTRVNPGLGFTLGKPEINQRLRALEKYVFTDGYYTKSTRAHTQKELIPGGGGARVNPYPNVGLTRKLISA